MLKINLFKIYCQTLTSENLDKNMFEYLDISKNTYTKIMRRGEENDYRDGLSESVRL